MPISSRSAHFVLWLAALAALLAVCSDDADAPPAGFRDRNPTPYQQVLALIEEGGRLPNAGDDLTLYLRESVDEAPAPRHAALDDSSQVGRSRPTGLRGPLLVR